MEENYYSYCDKLTARIRLKNEQKPNMKLTMQCYNDRMLHARYQNIVISFLFKKKLLRSQDNRNISTIKPMDRLSLKQK